MLLTTSVAHSKAAQAQANKNGPTAGVGPGENGLSHGKVTKMKMRSADMFG